MLLINIKTRIIICKIGLWKISHCDFIINSWYSTRSMYKLYNLLDRIINLLFTGGL